MGRQYNTMSPRFLLAVVGVLALAASGSEAKLLVEVDFYSETLCPYCANLTRFGLSEIFNTGVSDIADFRYIPWGNAHYDDSTSSITCQHGAVECEFNKLMSCVIDMRPKQDDWFGFLKCVEDHLFSGDQDLANVTKACAPEADVDPVDLLKCYNSPRADELQLKAMEETKSLVPPHEWVPWVVVNGVPIRDLSHNLLELICAAYMGHSKPKRCYEAQSSSVLESMSTKSRTYPSGSKAAILLPSEGASQPEAARKLI